MGVLKVSPPGECQFQPYLKISHCAIQYRECTRARSQSDCSIEYGQSIVSEVHPKYVRNFGSFRSFRTLSEVRALFL